MVFIGQSSNPSRLNPLHFQRGAHDGKRFAYDDINNDVPRCVSLDNPSITEDIPPEYLRPVPPDGEGQTVVCVAGPPNVVGQQRVTQYKSEGSWMMVPNASDTVGAFVVDEGWLCRLWKI